MSRWPVLAICNNLPMCGRYKLSRRKELLEEHFDAATDSEVEWIARYNIAPTQSVPVIRQNPKAPGRELSLVRWGLIPSWAKDASGAARMINARAETASTKPAFRDVLRSRRCLIPADGFYEWQRARGIRQPYCFEMNEGQLFAFAGIWDRWTDAARNTVESCSILTTTANSLTAQIHDRMPVILDPSSYELWLGPGFRDMQGVADLLQPFPASSMRSYHVSDRVNHVANDDEQCATPIEVTLAQAELFS